MVVGFLLSHTFDVMINHISAIAHVTMEHIDPIRSQKSAEEPPKIGQNRCEASTLLCVDGYATQMSSV